MARLSVLVVAVMTVMLIGLTCNVEGGYSTHNASEFTLAGAVLCQDCSKGWNQFAYGAVPIPGSVFDITCMDVNSYPGYYCRDTTDKDGQFKKTIPYSYKTFTLDPSRCKFTLISSGSEDCPLPTNFNGGVSGVYPGSPTNVYPDNILYDLGLFYYTITGCDTPHDS